MKPDAIKEMNKLARRFRRGEVLSMEDSARLDALTKEFEAGATPQPTPNTIWDLPVARALYEADRRSYLKKGGV